ncbi:MAG: ribosome biogenesis GTPase Der [Deltaproteobacteria bacterium]|nr:ribosome biogenesis GTPase Der [Deltaproteobacteria bacterium]
MTPSKQRKPSRKSAQPAEETQVQQVPLEGDPPKDDSTVPARPVPVVAILGRVNVGKSTLYNRLIGESRALVADVAGVTRDRRQGRVNRGDYQFDLLDTGGMYPGEEETFFAPLVEKQAIRAGQTADVLWLVVDGKDGLTPGDEDIYRRMARGKHLLVVVNKVDANKGRDNFSEFYSLGTDRIVGVSAAHGRGMEDLLEETARLVPSIRNENPQPETIVRPLRVAFFGRPNVGKSSLVNQILGEERMIVSERAGTTRESVDTPFQHKGESYLLVDTAGIRRRSRTDNHLEKIGVMASLSSLRRVHVAVLVLDATEPVSDQDCRLGGYLAEARRGVVIALNKWDRVPPSRQKSVLADVAERLRFLDYAPRVNTSALEGSGIGKLFREIRSVYAQFNREIKTADLNRVIQAMVSQHPHPSTGGRTVSIQYGNQLGTRPPRFCVFTNRPDSIREDYTRFFINQLRYHFGLEGTPVEVEWKAKGKKKPRPPAKPKEPGKHPTSNRGRSSKERWR